MFKEYLRRVKRIFQYVWYVLKYSDHDWDYSYLLRLMNMKLGWMEKAIREGHLLNCGKYADQIKQVRYLIKRIDEDNYHDQYWDFEKTQDKLEWVDGFGECYKLGGLYTQKNNLPIKLQHLKEPSNRQTDLNYLCDNLKKWLFKWWD